MFIKLQQFLNDEGISGNNDPDDCLGNIVPRRFNLIEANGVNYFRLSFKDYADFELKRGKKFPRSSYHIPFHIDYNNIDDFEAFFIDILDEKQEVITSIIAANCSLYLMNDNGKTIDSDHCKYTGYF